jgi:Uma2 family endonuclease
MISVDEYLKGEKYSTVKHEHVGGRAHAMVGGSSAHSLTAGNLHAAFHAHLRGKPCPVFIADTKLSIADAFYYPDLMVACDPSA